MSSPPNNPFAYHVTVESSGPDVWVASVREFPSLHAHGDTEAKAIKNFTVLLAAVIIDMVYEGEELPEPLPRDDDDTR